MDEKLKNLKEEREKDLKVYEKFIRRNLQYIYKDCYKCKEQKESGIYKMHNCWKYC